MGVGPAQLAVVPFELGDPLGVGRGRSRTSARVDLGLAQPAPQRLGADSQLAGHPGNHPEGLASLGGDGITGHADRPLT